MGLARDIALIFLGLEALAIGLVPLVMLAGLAYGVYRLRELTKVGLRKLQAIAEKIASGAEKGSHAVARPFISLHSSWHGLISMIRFVIGRRAAN